MASLTDEEEHHHGKVKTVANAWQSSETTQQHKMMELAQNQAELCGTSALVMLLSSAPVKLAHANAIAEPDVKKFTRLSFVVLRILDAGWSTVPANAEAAAILISAGKAAKRVPSVKLAEKVTEGCLMYSFAMLKRGAYNKGLRSDEGAILSPGMVFTLKAWTQNVAKVFKDQTEDLQPFEIAVAQLMLRSNICSKMDEMMDLKSITSVRGVSPAALRLIDSTLFPGSMQEAAIMRSRFGDGTYLSQQTFLNGNNNNMPVVMKPEWIRGNLSGTASVMRIPLSFGSGSFAIGPDDVLRFHIDASSSVIDLGFTSIVVYYDAHQFEGAPRDWIVAFFNVALMLDAIDLIVSVDTYQNKDTGGGGVIGFARIHVAVITAAILKNQPISLGSVPKTVMNVILTPGGHLAVYAFADAKVHVAIDTRRICRATTTTLAPPTISMVHMEAQWQKGYNVNVFVEGRLVFQFVAVADSAAGSSISAARGLQTITMVAPTFDVDDSTDAKEDPQDITTTATTMMRMMPSDTNSDEVTTATTEEEDGNQLKKRSVAAAVSGGGKRTKRSAENNE